MNWARLQKDKTLAHVVPLAGFMIVMGVLGIVVGEFDVFFRNHSDLPWWRRDPDQWIYPLQTVIGLAMLGFWWRRYDFNWSPKALIIGTIMGAVGIGFWLLPTQSYEWLGYASDKEVPWILAKLGVQERLDGFDARIFGDPARFDHAADWASLIMRFIRAAVVVALVEEIFWRGFLMRWLLDREGNYWKQPFGKPSWLTFGVTTVAFMFVHQPIDYAGAAIYGSLTYLVAIWTKSLGACVVMHGIANLLMGLYAINTGKLGLW
ncbi:MAG: CAAX prenyl protease-related protein [Verrucomicrobiota bacterium JB023]|nr:CAAX prenyl protease-related protein [Verrucomicrobiota bacterium JB023]